MTGHIVDIIEKKRLIERLWYPTYGDAMHAVVKFESEHQDNPQIAAVYHDERFFDVKEIDRLHNE